MWNVITPCAMNKPFTEFLKIYFCWFFPNRSLLLGFSSGIKEGSPRKHTQSVQRPLWPPGPGAQGPFENSSGFTIKVKIYFFILTRRKFFSGKTKHFSTSGSFSYSCWLLRQKSFLLIDLQESTLDTYTGHLHLKLTIDTYNRHLQ